MADNKEKIVTEGKLSDKKTFYATEKLKSVRDGVRKVGDPIELHPVRGASMMNSGKLTETPSKTTKSKE
jgi:hypothetical protein